MFDLVIVLNNLRKLVWVVALLLLTQIVLILYHSAKPLRSNRQILDPAAKSDTLWRAPDPTNIPGDAAGELIRYGRELIRHTSIYLGPQGKVMRISNGMNCQNCHLDGGTKPFAANYGAVASTYPKFRTRSNSVETFEKRVNDCIERSLNGTSLPHDSRELQAIIAYLKWVGKEVPKGATPKGAGLVTLPYLDRAADPMKGRNGYTKHCATCHGVSGEGVKGANKHEWQYPPLWGANSYNTGAGLYRISRFAAFIKTNMPYGVTHTQPILSDEEAWDIAAFVNSMPRPHKSFPSDWPDLRTKPIDHPFGPYADAFSEAQHKYGPFKPIEAAHKTK